MTITDLTQAIRNAMFGLYAGEHRNMPSMFNRNARKGFLALVQVVNMGPAGVPDLWIRAGSPSAMEGFQQSPGYHFTADGQQFIHFQGTYDATQRWEIDYGISTDNVNWPSASFVNDPTNPPFDPFLPWPTGVLLYLDLLQGVGPQAMVVTTIPGGQQPTGPRLLTRRSRGI